MSNLQLADEGNYDVVVTDTVGPTTSQAVPLNVDPTFTNVMTGVIVTDAEGSISGIWADYDNDGYLDLYVANLASAVGGARNTLYHNEGGTNFTRVASSPFTTDFMRTWMAAWGGLAQSIQRAIN